ncbi:MAG TPA: 5'/3'-nucleotidase SurE, partial [Candidatus Polarisedimenticolaceae bacterium]|nr:5'/3'-nucleotidase SurE [Candidatus Polarisedimenticolaceae bacterium]
ALEATILGVPGVAFSLVARENFNFSDAAQFAITAVRKVLAEGLPEGTLLNVNFPQKEFKGVRVTRQGLKNARPVISEHIDPRGKPYFWVGEEYFNADSAEGTDYHAIDQGYVSVTPLKSDMTDHRALTALDAWNYLKDPELVHEG